LVCILYGCSVPVILRGLKEIPKLGQRIVQNVAKQMDAESETFQSSANGPTGEHQPHVPFRPLAYGKSGAQTVTSSDQIVCYKLIGECYVHGRMDGEAIDNDNYSQSEQDFMLV